MLCHFAGSGHVSPNSRSADFDSLARRSEAKKLYCSCWNMCECLGMERTSSFGQVSGELSNLYYSYRKVQKPAEVKGIAGCTG